MSKLVALSVESMDGLQSKLDPRFGRSHAFLIFDADSRTITSQFFNNAASAACGAGTAAAVAMNSNHVGAVISGRFGPKAIEALRGFNIEMWIAPEGISASRALKQFRAGKLSKMELKVY